MSVSVVTQCIAIDASALRKKNSWGQVERWLMTPYVKKESIWNGEKYAEMDTMKEKRACSKSSSWWNRPEMGEDWKIAPSISIIDSERFFRVLKSVSILNRLYQLSLAKTEFATLFLTHVIKQFPRKKASVKVDSVDEWSFCLCFLNESHYILSICICFFQKNAS